MHNSYTRAGGMWAPFTVVLAAELADLDAKTFKAANFDDGGTWAPSSVITIGGQGINVTGPAAFGQLVSFGSDVAVTGRVFAHGQLIVGGSASFSAPVTFVSSATIDGVLTVSGSPSFAGLASFSNGISVTGSSAFQGVTLGTLATSGNAFVAGALHTAGSATFDSGINVTGTATLAGVACTDVNATTLAASGTITGRSVRPAVVGTASTTTLSPVNGNEYYFGASLTADTTVQISDAGAVDGDWIEVCNASTGHTVSINDPGGSLMITIKNLSGQIDSVRFKRIAGTWVKFSVTHVP